MKPIHERLAGRRVGIVAAHPDDNLIHNNALWIAREAGADVEELTLSRGRAGQNLRTRQPDFVASGRRTEENERGAAALGIQYVELWDYPDRQLGVHAQELIPKIGGWLAEHDIEVVLTTGTLADHHDHLSVAKMVREAATTAILEQRPDGDWHAPATPSSIRATLNAAAHHSSQFLVAHTVVPGWEHIEDTYVHPDTLAGLDRYPIRRDAHYAYIPAPANTLY